MDRFFKTVLTTVIAIATPLFGLAESVSPKEALRLAQTFFNSAHGQVMERPKLVYNGRGLTTDRLFSPFYVYNLPGGGFVIISAENKAFPILGYDTDNSFDPNHIDADVYKVLSNLARDIELVRYDSRLPVEAISAWSYYRSYLAATLEGNPIAMLRDKATEFDFRDGYPHPSEEQSIMDEENDEYPFSFYERFLTETDNERQQRLRMFDERLLPTQPVVSYLGGGHFQIHFPETISMARIYNMQGALINTLTFKNTDTAFINLDKEPPGFYVALVNGNSGKPYGFKLYK